MCNYSGEGRTALHLGGHSGYKGTRMKTKGYDHQNKDYERSKDLDWFAVWWEQGLGKSKLLIDTVCHLFETGDLNGLLVVAPNGVHANIVTQEWPVHGWDSVREKTTTYIYYTAMAGTKKHRGYIDEVTSQSSKRFSILVMPYSSVKTKLGMATAKAFLEKRKCLMVLDESTAIADPKSQTSKAIAKLGPLAVKRRVMSGTPVADGPFKIYNQIKFLDQDYWKNYGLSSFVVFRSCFALFEKRRAAAGHSYDHLLSYRNLDKLHALVEPISSRVLKEDALDLPPKVYSTVEFYLSQKQQEIYETLVKEFRVSIEADRILETDSAMTRIMRLQQITSGHIVVETKPPLRVGDPVVTLDSQYAQRYGEVGRILENDCVEIGWVEGNLEYTVEKHSSEYVRLVKGDQETHDLFPDSTNPRLLALRSILEPITHKVIIWCRFTRDVDLVCEELQDEAVRYDGKVNDVNREIALDRFRTDPRIRYFIANPEALSMGVTLTQAKTVIYYSNSFKLEKRLQSEDRAHRIGQDVSVNIVDIVAYKTVDRHIADTLRKKYDLSASVMGDRLREWIA